MGSEVVTFGEIMLRLSPPGNERLVGATSLESHYGGAEANVAVALAQMRVSSSFVSAVPDQALGEGAVRTVRSFGVDTNFVKRAGPRLGLYFLEHGASQRPSTVIYDRAGSSISLVQPGDFDWAAIFAGAKWFHFSGITAGLSPNAAQTVREAAEAAKGLGLTVSCDLNYRKKLWTEARARETMTGLMEWVDVLLANEEDAASVFGINGSDVEAGPLDQVRYEQVAAEMASRFNLKIVAITLRESHSASRNGWSGMIYRDGKAYVSRKYEIDVVDRIGSGDCFAAGLIYGSLHNMEPQDTIEFAAAAGCLAHSVPGDFAVLSLGEVEALVRGEGSGRVQR